MKRRRQLIILTLFAAVACGGPPAPEGAVPQLPPAEPGLRPGDAVMVNVWQEEDLTGEFQVSQSGIVVLPLIGEKQVLGIEVADHEAQIRNDYREYLLNPSVTITAIRRIAILGEVLNPGLYPVDATVSLTEALAMAGGIGPVGNPEDIRLIRNGVVLVQSLDAAQTIQSLPIQSGDQIQVGPQGWLSRNRYFIGMGMAAVTSIFVALVIYGGY